MKKITATIIVLSYLLVIPVISEPENYPTPNVNLDVLIRNVYWDGAIATSHNGGILYGPQDTILVFAKSCEAGADIIEVDIRITSDGHLIAFHDEEFDFTNSTGSGLVRERTLEYVRSIETISLLADVENQPIPTFREVLQFLKEKQVCLNVEPKDNVIEKIIEDVRAEGMENNVLIQAKSADKAALIRRLDDKVGMIARYHSEQDLEAFAPYHPEVMEVDPQVSDEIIARIRAMGTKVQMKTGYLKDMDFEEKSWQKRIDRGVQVALTDFVPGMVSFLRRTSYNVGSEAKPRKGSQQLSGYTYINTEPLEMAKTEGNLKYLRVFMNTSGEGKVKVFRKTNENMVLVAESKITALRKGLNIVPINASVVKGDFIGFYLEAGEVEAEKNNRGINCLWARGDVGSSSKNNWFSANCTFSVDGIVR